jgi:hypothetical protein
VSAKIDKDGPEPVSPDVRLCEPGNLRWSPEGNQPVEDIGYAPVSNPGCQLAVRKGTGSPLTELDVAFRIEKSPPPELLDVAQTLVNGLPPLEERRAQAIFGKPQCRKKTCRAGADYHHPALCGNPREGLCRLFRQEDKIGITRMLEKKCLLVIHGKTEGADEVNLSLAAGVDAFSDQITGSDGACRDRKSLGENAGKIRFCGPERKAYIADLEGH